MKNSTRKDVIGTMETVVAKNHHALLVITNANVTLMGRLFANMTFGSNWPVARLSGLIICKHAAARGEKKVPGNEQSVL